MSAIRTQIYLTPAQRQRLDALRWREDKSLAEVIREAIDAYVGGPEDPAAALKSTFGAIPDFDVPPRDEWERLG